ncbi:MAG: neutral/alkaline non-lysosomal ceramidase N-terminal domain-containing protein [Planctomycetaceae bacterium]
MNPTTPSKILQAGVGRVCITPPVGIRLMGYTVQECVSDSVERDLTATALVLSDGKIKVVLLACDLLFIQSPHVERIRQRVGDELHIPADNVLINTSHTHLGPMFPGWQADTPAQQRIQERYLAVLEESLTGVAMMADKRLQPARIGAGKGHAPIGINRRERLPDGRVVIGENPEGPVDHDVGVIRIDDLAGRPIATIMIAAAHTIVLGPKTSQLSPDYVGPAREIVERATGAASLFFQGAAGNVSPRCGIGSGGPEQFDDLHRIGAMLGGETLKVWSQIRTHNRHGPRRIVQSVAAISTWDYEPLPENMLGHFSVGARRITLPMASLPERKTAEEGLAHWRERMQQAKADGRIGPIHVAQRLVHWAELVLKTIDEGKPVTRDLVCWGLRVNDVGIVAVNGEPFAELALEVKRRSPLAHTYFLGYSNGCLGYFPTPQAFDEGGMEVNESYQNYMLPAQFTRAWGPAVVENSLSLLKELN